MPETLVTASLLPVKGLQQKLKAATPLQLIIFLSLTSFSVYTCMYGFRKPYTSASFSSYSFLGFSFKSILVISQSVGYMLSKWIGIRFIATIAPKSRAKSILALLLIGWSALLLFAITPAPYNCIFMFMNGLPLGMVWGLVFGYLEGRTFTDIIAAVLGTSFIFASGLAKTVGKFVTINFQVSEMWMPFMAGAFFVIPAIIAVLLLNQSPPPTIADVQLKTARKPMAKSERKAFIKNFASILIPVCLSYVLLTIIRDFCEDFSNELWVETGYSNNASIFTQTGTYMSFIVLFVVGSFFLIKNNYKAYQLNYLLIAVGFSFCILGTILFQLGIINPFYWFLIATTGMYFGYVSYNCVFFERMIATFKVNGTVGFVMYIADSVGYLGAVAVLLIKETVHFHYSWVTFFTYLFYGAASIGIVFIIWSSSVSKFKFQKFIA
jgi:MFS family permease